MTRSVVRRFRAVACTGLGLCLIGIAHAADAATILPTQDERKAIRARAQWVSGPDAVDSAPAIDVLTLLPFDERLEVEESTLGAVASGVAELRTNRTATRIDAFGFASGRAEATETTFARGGGDSLYRIEFMVDEPTRFRLKGRLTGTGTDPFIDVLFDGTGSPGGAHDLRFDFSLSEAGDRPFDVTGVLMPEVFYFLSGNAFVSSFAGQSGGEPFVEATAEFTAALIVPEPGSGLLLALIGIAAWRARPQGERPCPRA